VDYLVIFAPLKSPFWLAGTRNTSKHLHSPVRNTACTACTAVPPKITPSKKGGRLRHRRRARRLRGLARARSRSRPSQGCSGPAAAASSAPIGVERARGGVPEAGRRRGPRKALVRGAPASAGAARPARGSVGTRAGLRSVGAAAEPLFVGTRAALVSGETRAARAGLHARAGLRARRRARFPPRTRYLERDPRPRRRSGRRSRRARRGNRLGAPLPGRTPAARSTGAPGGPRNSARRPRRGTSGSTPARGFGFGTAAPARAVLDGGRVLADGRAGDAVPRSPSPPEVF